jgi:MFS family permease
VRQALAPLRERNFAWFFASQFVNISGSMMAGVGLAFAILEISDSASAIGQVLAARTIPMVVFLLWGGVIADRISRTLIVRTSNLLSALTQGTVAYLVLSGQAELWMIIVLEAVNGTTAAVSMPAMDGMVPQLVRREQLQATNVLLSMSRSILAIVGPSVAAILVVTVGPGWALAVDASTWLVAALLMAKVKIPAREQREGAPKPSTLHELREGWRLFIGIRWLWIIVAAFAVLNAIMVGALFTLGPALASRTIGADGWGYALSAQAVGLLAMTFVLLRVNVRRPLLSGMIGMSLFTVPLIMYGLDPAVVPLVIAMFVAGGGIQVFSIGWDLAMQENIDERLLSRAYSYDAVGSFVAMPVGQLIYGPLGDAFGYQQVFVVSGIVYAAVCALTLASPSVRNLRRTAVAEPAATR